jgi:hypothetical protein
MTPLLRSILHTFDEYVFGFMRSDINAAMRGNANFLAALGLVSYTEVLGGLRTGKLGLIGKSQHNFNAFLCYMGDEYMQFQKKDINIYDVVRCGLVHNYFIKGDATIWMHAGTGSNTRGIVASPNGTTHFFVNVYRDDFFAGATKYRDEILDASDPTLAENFRQGMDQIGITLS